MLSDSFAIHSLPSPLSSCVSYHLENLEVSRRTGEELGVHVAQHFCLFSHHHHYFLFVLRQLMVRALDEVFPRIHCNTARFRSMPGAIAHHHRKGERRRRRRKRIVSLPTKQQLERRWFWIWLFSPPPYTPPLVYLSSSSHLPSCVGFFLALPCLRLCASMVVGLLLLDPIPPASVFNVCRREKNIPVRLPPFPCSPARIVPLPVRSATIEGRLSASYPSSLPFHMHAELQQCCRSVLVCVTVER